MSFEYIWLPSDFTFLLQSDMQATGYGFQYLKKTLWSQPHFQSVYLRAVADLDVGLKFDKAVNSLGWLGIRDRLCSLYLYHNKHGRFPAEPDLRYVKDLLVFEDKVSSKTSQGTSHAYLLGFYILMEGSRSEGNVQRVDELKHFLDFEMTSLLQMVKTKTVQLDWLLLSLWYFKKFLGVERVKKLANSSGGFNSLRASLDKKQQYQFYRGLLNYGASVNNDEIFHKVTI